MKIRPALNLWVLLAFFVCSGVALVTVNIVYTVVLMRSRLTGLCDIAGTAYATGGPKQLQIVSDVLQKGIGLRAYLIDYSGRDLAIGQDRSTFLSNGPDRPRAVRLVERTPDYSCVIVREGIRPPLPPLIWAMPFLAVLCGVLSVCVTLRLRRIEDAIRHFGSGKLNVRVNLDTGDPIGRLSRAFNQMAERIESLVEAHRRLCVDISHELRSPLARLRLAIGLARTGTRSALDRIEIEAARLHDLVDELLDVARAEVDPAALEFEPVDVKWLMTDLAEDCAIEAKECECSLELKFPNAGTINGNPEMLRRAVENIVRNAIRHSKPGAPIELIADGDDRFAVISIRDRGPGVPDSALQEIFHPFYRVDCDRDRSTGGVGLGLSIAERAIKIHRGSVKAENARPGLLVEIRLPRDPIASA